jgi:protein gp37
MNKTNIEWVKNPDGSQGYTWNPITGCLNHTPEGLCLGGLFPCYAYKLANGRLRERYWANTQVACEPIKPPWPSAINNPFYPRFWESRLKDLPNIALRVPWSKERGIFVCDMGELFGDWIPEKWQQEIFDRIKCYSEHRFYLLTKQPQNLAKWSPFPENCWVGVTVCNNGAMTLALENLANIQAKVRFISFEPLLGYIGMKDHMSIKGIVDWVIIGAQTKPYKPPKIEWVEEIVNAADQAGIPVFLKDNLKPMLRKVDYILPTNIAMGAWLRQEMPGAERRTK